MEGLESLFNYLRADYYSNFNSFQDFREYIFDTQEMSARVNEFFDALCQEQKLEIEDKSGFFAKVILSNFYSYYRLIDDRFNERYLDNEPMVNAISIVYFYYNLLKSEGKLNKYDDIDSFRAALVDPNYRQQFFGFLEELDYSSAESKQIVESYHETLKDINKQLEKLLKEAKFIDVAKLLAKDDWWAFTDKRYCHYVDQFISSYFEKHIASSIAASDDISQLSTLKEEVTQVQVQLKRTHIQEDLPEIKRVFSQFSDKVSILEKKLSSQVFQNLILKQQDQYNKIVKSHPVSVYCDELEQVVLNDNPDIAPKYFTHVRIGTYSNNNETVNITLPIFERKSLAWDLKLIEPQKVYNAIQNIVIRMVMALPVGHVKVRIVDEDMGSNFQMLLGLPEDIKGNEIYYDATQVSTLFDNLKKRDSKIVFEKLKNQYSNLIEYNIQNEFNYEPLEIIVINGFPSCFGDQFLKYISNQIQKSCKTGCYYLIAYNDNNLMKEIDPSNYHSIISASTLMSDNLNSIFPSTGVKKEIELKFTPDYELVDLTGYIVNAFTEHYGKINTSENTSVQSKEDNTFSSNSAAGIVIPIGKNSKGKSLDLDFSENTSAYHGIICGTTGSGKTVMLHQIITKGANIYGPDELQFVLLDYKLGTEFNAYRNLPHARVVAIDADIEFGYETLKFLTDTMAERANLFKKYKVANLEDYRTKSSQKCPRILVIIDEFQVLLEGANVDRSIADEIRKLMDSVVRLGRSFGIHLLLSTQTPSGIKWSGSTMENIALRIGLRMSSESETYLFKHKTPISSRFTQKYGKAVYNDKGGVESDDLPSVVFDTEYVDPEKVPAMVEIIKIDAEKNKSIPETRTVYENNVAINYIGKPLNEISWSTENKNISYSIGSAANILMSDVTVEMTTDNLEHGIILGAATDNILDLQTLAIAAFVENSNTNSQIIVFSDSQEDENRMKMRLRHLKEISVNYIQGKTAFLDFINKMDADISGYNPLNTYERTMFVAQGISSLSGFINPNDFEGSRNIKPKWVNMLSNGNKVGLLMLIACAERPLFNQAFGFSYDDFEFAISVPGIKNMYKKVMNETYELQTNMGVLYKRRNDKETKFNRITFN